MNILVVCQYYYPENFQITPICEQLAADGHDVTVLTGLPNYPTGTIPLKYQKGHRKEKRNGVKIFRCAEIGKKKGVIYLAMNYLSYCISASLKIKKLSHLYDLVFVYQLSPILMGIPGQIYSKRHHIPMVIYCCDLWPESMKMYIKSEKSFIFRIVKIISKSVYSSADLIACQSSMFIDYLSNTHGIPKNKLKYLPAFADESYLEKDFTPEDDIIDFVFMGNLGIAQNLLAVLKAVKKISYIPGFKVHFVGTGTVLKEMKNYVLSHNLLNIVFFYGRRPVQEMPKFYKIADVCLVSLKADNFTGLTLPSKVQGYMAAGKPILGMIDGSAKQVIEESKCGICVSPDDIDGFANAMKSFIIEKEKYINCGQNGREYFMENFARKIFMTKLESEFERLVK